MDTTNVRTMAQKLRQLRVLLVAPVAPPYGGMALQGQRLLENFSKEGVEVCLVRTNQRLPRFFSKIPVLRTALNSLIFNVRMFATIGNAEVVYILSASYAYFFLHTVPVVIAGRIFGKKVFINYRGGLAEDFLQRWIIVVKPFFELATGVIVPSLFLQTVFKKFGIETDIVPNIVDVRLFTYQARRVLQPKLIVSRHLESVYNIECVIKAYQEVKKEFPNAQLGIVGDGSQEQYLKALVDAKQIRDVVFYGAVPQNELADIYAQYDIYVNGSNVDNFPGAIMEAFACGLAVVSTKAGGISYMIEDGRTGFLVDLHDYRAMAERVVRLIKNPVLAQEMIENARKECLQCTWPQVREKFSQVCGV